jgi:hypothetical protein
MFFCCVCCVLSGRGLCDGLITRPEESYRIWRVVVSDQETSWYEEAIARAGLQCQRNKQHTRPRLGLHNLLSYVSKRDGVDAVNRRTFWRGF